jgi:hypothetical protein
MTSKVVNRKELKLKDDPKLLSPPILDEPIYQCAIAVTVRGYVANATIEVRVNGTTVASVPGGAPWPNGITVVLPNPLVAGDKVRTRQKTTTTLSGWSAAITVRDHTNDYPAGPPRPQINPAPVYKCGVRTGVGNLLTGGHVWITADGATVGDVKGCAQQQGINVSPAYGLGQKVRAWFELCKDPSPPSVEHVTQIPPSPVPTPTLDPIYAGGTQVTVWSIVNGAKVTIYRGGVNQGTWPCWGGGLSVDGFSPFTAGESFTATQEMCPGDPPSTGGGGTVQPCSALPAPQVGPVQGGDNRVTLTGFVPDATIRVYLNGVLVGVGGGPVVMLTQTVKCDDTLIVVQDLLGCIGQWATQLTVACVDPPVAGNPAELDLFPVGWLEYSDGARKGRVYYPGDDDGEKQPVHKRLAALGRVPIVFMAHGNHSPADPSYLGYDYFQHDLAKMGIIAVSIDCNALNGGYLSMQNIEDRADLIIDNIDYFQGVDGDPGSIFHQRIDFGRVGLMGHSRGGDAVVTAASVIALPGVAIKSCLALAPTNARFQVGGLSTIQPKGYAFMTLLPAGDGDVRDNNGAQFYDQAVPAPFKSQLYVHYTNHNFFNRQWLNDDSLNYPQPPVIARVEHERVLTAYGCALFRATLLGQTTNLYLAGDRLPASVMTAHVHLSYQKSEVLTVDNHEDGNTINKNSLNRPTSQFAGMSADEYPFRKGAAGAFNSSFYGDTVGMVVKPGKPGRIFRSELAKTTNLTKSEIWIRAAEVTDGANVPAGATGFKLGLEDKNGGRAWVDSDEVGGLPRPYNRNPGMIKTMLKTLRFKGGCFDTAPKFDLKSVRAVLIKCDRKDERAFAFDDLQIVK